MRKSIIGGLGVGSGMAIFVAVSLPTGGVSVPSLLAGSSANFVILVTQGAR
jgi:hypothetical protein